VRVLDVPNRTQTLSERFDAPFEQLFEMQDRLCLRLSELLRTELASTVLSCEAPAEAIELYLRGRHKARSDDLTAPDGAVALLARAAALAPQFKAAHAACALATVRAWWLPNPRPPEEWEPEARASVAADAVSGGGASARTGRGAGSGNCAVASSL